MINSTAKTALTKAALYAASAPEHFTDEQLLNARGDLMAARYVISRPARRTAVKRIEAELNRRNDADRARCKS